MSTNKSIPNELNSELIRENVREKEKTPQGIPNFCPAKVPKTKKKSGQDEFPNRISMAE